MIKMINQIEDIEYIERKDQWYLWYINHTGSLDNLVFQTESDANLFKRGFDFIAKSLNSNQEKICFYEKTTLTKVLIKRFIALGSSIDYLTETLNMIGLAPEIKLRLKDKKT